MRTVCVILGGLGLVLLLVALENITEACHHTVRPYPSEGSDLGGGVITPVLPVVPSGPMTANVRVVSDPQGGSHVSELSCAFEVTEIPGAGTNPIVITVNWVAPCGTHGSDAFIFDGGKQVFESTYSVNGRYIGLTFWATISWKDAHGMHQIQSGFAVCSG